MKRHGLLLYEVYQKEEIMIDLSPYKHDMDYYFIGL